MKRVGIYIYNDVEVLDFAGPFEVFSTANRLCGREPCFEVFLIGETGEPVVARAGFTVLPFFSFKDHPDIDVLVVPGGVHVGEMNKKAVIDWIYRQSKKASLAASVCTGVFLLAQAGVVDSQKVTTHWEDLEELGKLFPKLEVTTGIRWVDAGEVVSSGGISAGIDMCLHLVRRLCGTDLARRTARQMEFAWEENP